MYDVLLVSDLSEATSYYKKLGNFAEYGFTIVGQTKNRGEFTEALKRGAADLYIVEEGFSGLEYAEIDNAIRACNPEAEIIAVTTSDSPLREKKVLGLGAFSYLRRPLASATFDMVIESVKVRLARTERLKALGGTDEYKLKYRNMVLSTLLLTAERSKDSSKTLREIGFKADGYFRLIVVSAVGNSEDAYNLVKTYFNENYSAEVFTYSGKTVVIACGGREELEGNASVCLDGLNNVLKRIFDKFAVGASKVIESVNEIPIAYSSALAAVSDKTDDKPKAAMRADKAEKAAAAVLDAIKGGGEVEVGEVLRKELSTSYSGLTSEEIAFAGVKIVSFCQTLLSETSEVAAREEFFAKLAVLACSSAYREDLIALCVAASKALDTAKTSASVSVAGKCYEIIKAEYKDADLSVKTLSDRLNISQNYLSTLMKKNFGDTFVNILTKTRMERAKELLHYTRKKVSEICEEVGYSDSHYFSYNFKKFYGISPLEMRNGKDKDNA